MDNDERISIDASQLAFVMSSFVITCDHCDFEENIEERTSTIGTINRVQIVEMY